MPRSRPSRYCFALQDDSVFADFDLDDNGHVFLLRISFDRYGCCGTAEESTRMSFAESERFVGLIESNRISSEEFIQRLEHYFKQNKDVIWSDALEEYGLLPA